MSYIYVRMYAQCFEGYTITCFSNYCLKVAVNLSHAINPLMTAIMLCNNTYSTCTCRGINRLLYIHVVVDTCNTPK